METFLLIWSALAGTSGLINVIFGGRTYPTATFPLWLDVFWYLLLTAGATVCLVGVYLRDVITGVLLVRAGMLPLGSGAVIYSGAHLTQGHPNVATIILAFGLSCLWRAHQIRHHLIVQLRAQPTVLGDDGASDRNQED